MWRECHPLVEDTVVSSLTMMLYCCCQICEVQSDFLFITVVNKLVCHKYYFCPFSENSHSVQACVCFIQEPYIPYTEILYLTVSKYALSETMKTHVYFLTK